jgi:hypothetical protein
MLFSLARNELIIYWKNIAWHYSWERWLHFRAPSHFQVESKLSKKIDNLEPRGSGTMWHKGMETKMKNTK